MSTRSASSLAMLLLAIGGLAAPATSDAARLQTARFRATLTASTSTSWTLNNSTACGTEAGSGTERMKFHQAGRLTLRFYRQLGGSHLLWVRVVAPKPTDIPIKGEWTRNGKVVVTSNGKCQTGGGQVVDEDFIPPSPDCGTKSFAGTIRPTWSPPESYPGPPEAPTPLTDVLWLDEPYSPTSFRVCPYYGPLIVFRLSHGALPERKVFGSSPRFKVSDSAKKVNQYPYAAPGVRSETSVSWTMRLTRVG